MPSSHRTRPALLLALGAWAAALHAQSLPGEVRAAQKISATAGGLVGPIKQGDLFGTGLASLGDLDGNGVGDLAVGAIFDDDGAAGAVWILFLDDDGAVLSEQKISATAGGFGGTLAAGDFFGDTIAFLGDLDGDGVGDIAVGATSDNDGGADAGAVWILFLDTDGTVKAEQKISALAGGFGGALEGSDLFGAVAAVGDLDGDGNVDLAVGARQDDDGGSNAGAVWILFLDTDGTVKSEQKISAAAGGLVGLPTSGDFFGTSVAALGDLDGDGVEDLAVGAQGEDAVDNEGAVWILFLDTDGTVTSEQKISPLAGGFTGTLDVGEFFGRSLARLGDVNGDGVTDLAVGAERDDDGGGAGDQGALWILFLDTDGTVVGHRKISATEGGFTDTLGSGDFLGRATAALGDHDGDGVVDVAVGAERHDDGGGAGDQGAVWILFLAGAVEQSVAESPIGAIEGHSGKASVGLSPPPPPGAGDAFYFQPVVVMPKTDEDKIDVQLADVQDTTVSFSHPMDQVGEFATGDGPVATHSADFDGDGGGDVVTANQLGGTLSFLESDEDPGDPAFEPQVLLTVPDGGPVAVLAANLDGDADLDLVTAGVTSVTAFTATGPGTFGAGVGTLVQGPDAFHTDIGVGDWDGDGDDDVLTTSGTSTPLDGFVTVLENVAGTLVVDGTIALGTPAASVLMADFDTADGQARDDALVVVHDFDVDPGAGVLPSATIQLYRSNGNGTFTPTVSFDVSDPDGIVPLHGAAGDIDNDGDVDAVFTSSDNLAHPAGTFADEHPPIELTLLLNDGAGGFVLSTVSTPYAGKGVTPGLQDLAPQPSEPGGPFLDCVLVWYGDDGAGLPDDEEQPRTYVSAMLWDDELATFVDAAPNQFLVGNEPGNGAVGELETAASSGSPAPDVVVPQAVPGDPSGALAVLLNDGTGQLVPGAPIGNVTDLDPETAHPTGTWQGGPRDVVLADVDGDGHLDAMVYSEFEDITGLETVVPASVSIFPGAGTGALLARSAYLDPARGGELAAAQLDGDARADLVLTQRRGSRGNEALLLFTGNGDATLAPAGNIAMPRGALLTGGLAIADVDGDAVPDVLTTATDRGAAALAVVTDPLGAPVLSLHPLPGTWTEVRSLDVADVTHDGELDAIIGVRGGQLVVAAGDGAGAFAPWTIGSHSAAVGGGALRVADVTGDGRPDILSSNRAETSGADQSFVRVLRSTSSGSFEVSVLGGASSVGLSGSLRPLLADMDDDGATDTVLVHGGASGSVSVQLNPLHAFESAGAGSAQAGLAVPTLEGRGYSTPGGRFVLRLRGAPGGGLGALEVGAPLPAGLTEGWLPVAVGELFAIPGAPGVPGAGELDLEGSVPVDASLLGESIALRVVVAVAAEAAGGAAGAAPGVVPSPWGAAPATTSARVAGGGGGGGATPELRVAVTNTLVMTIVDGK